MTELYHKIKIYTSLQILCWLLIHGWANICSVISSDENQSTKSLYCNSRP